MIIRLILALAIALVLFVVPVQAMNLSQAMMTVHKSQECTGYNCGFETDSDLVALYNLEDGALGTDSKGNNDLTNDGVASAAILYKQGSYAGNFDISETDLMSIADASLKAGFPGKSSSGSTTFSLCAWVYMESSEASNFIISKYGGTTENTRTYALVITSDNKLHLYLGYDGGGNVEDKAHASTLSDTTWYHVCGTYENTGKTYGIYVRDTDGTTVGSDIDDTATLDVSGLSLDTEEFRLGAFSTSGSAAGHFDGVIDEVAIFKKKITATEATNISKGLYK